MKHGEDYILVVDDEPDIRVVLTNFLKEHGFSVLCAENGRNALEVLSSEKVAAIITDLMMPEMDGLTFVSELKKQRVDIDVALMTGYSSVESAIMALKNGVYDYLEKPLCLPDILLSVKRMMEHQELKKKNLEYQHIIKEYAMEVTKVNRQLKKANEELENMNKLLKEKVCADIT